MEPKSAPKIGGLRLVGSVSSKVQSDPKRTFRLDNQQEDKKLNQEEFDKYWNELMSSSEPLFAEMAASLKNYHPVVNENGDFVLEVPNSYMEAEFRKYKVQLLTLLRDRSGARSMNCVVNVVHKEVETKAYQPEEKYQKMLERNNKLADLRSVFPTIDY